MAPRSDPSVLYDALAAAARSPSAPVSTLIRAGIAAIDARRENETIPLLEQHARRGLRDPWLLHTLGLLYRAQGDLAEALIWIDRSLAANPNAKEVVHSRAVATWEAGLPSLPWFEQARRLNPDHAPVLLGYVAALASEDSPATADHVLARILATHPGWIEGHAALIRARYAEQHDNVMAVLDMALAGAPRDPRLHHLKIISLMRAKSCLATDAVAAARAALGDSARLWADTAIVATEQGHLRDADTAFAQIDTLSEPDIAINWMRHLLRRGEAERVAALFGQIEGPILDAAWPYLSLAWRLLDDPRSTWLDRDEFVRIIDLAPEALGLDTLAALLPELHRSGGQPLDQSVRGGTQTSGPLLSRVAPPIRRLRAVLETEVTDYINHLPAAELGHPLLGRVPTRPRFAGAWSVRLTEGGYHEPHIHSMGWISSALYIALPDSTPPAGWLTLGEAQSSLNIRSGPVRLVEPRVARLVLFPSTLWHGTRPFTEGVRLSVACDIH